MSSTPTATPTAETPKSGRCIHPRYRPDIDGLRAIAVFSVVVFHAFPSLLRGGFIGVDVFFVISGFLISSIIFDGLNKGEFSFGDFYSRRIRRIFPALVLVLAGCGVMGWVVLAPSDYGQLGKHISGGAGFVANLMFWWESGYFDSAAVTKPLLHLWSLAVEEQSYFFLIYQTFSPDKHPFPNHAIAEAERSHAEGGRALAPGDYRRICD